jgi:hypothetical protein
MREDETLNTPDGHPLLEPGSVAPCEQCGGKAGDRTIHLPLELPHIPDVIRPLMSPLSPGRSSPQPPPDFARMVRVDSFDPILRMTAHLGLAVSDPVHLRSTNNVVVWLRPAPVVVKATASPENGLGWELEVAAALYNAGAPLAGPSALVEPVVHHHGDWHMSFWTYHRQTGPIRNLGLSPERFGSSTRSWTPSTMTRPGRCRVGMKHPRPSVTDSKKSHTRRCSVALIADYCELRSAPPVKYRSSALSTVAYTALRIYLTR